MKKLLSSAKTTVILLVVTVMLLGAYVYMLARPISYGMEYHNETVFQGQSFEGTMKFYPNKTMVISNSNFKEEQQSRYYYQDGYIFFTAAMTDEAYEEEVAMIKEHFDEAVETPFYADKINAFALVAEGMEEGEQSVYACRSASVFAVVFGIVEIVLIVLTYLSWIFYRRSKRDQ